MDARLIIAEIESYSSKTGLRTSTVCQRAFGNARYLDRLTGRLERAREELERFRAFVAANPPEPFSDHQNSNQETPHAQSSSDTASDAA